MGSTPDVLAEPRDFTANCFGLNSIRQDAPKIWSSLPDKIRSTTNKRTLQKQVRNSPGPMLNNQLKLVH